MTPEPAPPPPDPVAAALAARDARCEAGGADLTEFVRAWKDRHGLTDAEARFIVTTLLVRVARGDVITERHAELTRNKLVP